MARKLKPDRILFLVTLGLVGSGVAMVFSSSAIVAKEKFGDPNYFSFKQLIFATLGLAVMFVVMKVDYHTYRRPVVVFSGLAAVVALLVLVFFLATSANTHRWIQLAGFSVQPSEIAKLALIFFLAYFLEKRRSNINDLAFTIVPIAVIVALLAGLIVLLTRGNKTQSFLRERLQQVRGTLPEPEHVQQYAQQVADRVSQAAGDVKDTAQQAMKKVKNVGSDLGDKAKRLTPVSNRSES